MFEFAVWLQAPVRQNLWKSFIELNIKNRTYVNKSASSLSSPTSEIASLITCSNRISQVTNTSQFWLRLNRKQWCVKQCQSVYIWYINRSSAEKFQHTSASPFVSLRSQFCIPPQSGSHPDKQAGEKIIKLHSFCIGVCNININSNHNNRKSIRINICCVRHILKYLRVWFRI